MKASDFVEITTTEYATMGAMEFIGQTRVNSDGIYHTCWKDNNGKYWKVRNTLYVAPQEQCMECGRPATESCQYH